MLTITEIAARVGAAQYDLADGRRRIEVEKELISLRKEIVAGIHVSGSSDDDILADCRTDAMEQLSRLRELLYDLELQSIPDMEMFHLSACCELCRQKVNSYFNLRNRVAESRVHGGIPCQA